MRRFIGDHKDCLVKIEDNLQNLIIMADHLVCNVQITVMISLTRVENNQPSGENHNTKILQEPFCDLELKREIRSSLTKETLI